LSIENFPHRAKAVPKVIETRHFTILYLQDS
jgi:hypothetical protein